MGKYATFSNGYWQTSNKQGFVGKETIKKQIREFGYRIIDEDEIDQTTSVQALRSMRPPAIVPDGDGKVYRYVATTSYKRQGEEWIEYAVWIHIEKHIQDDSRHNMRLSRPRQALSNKLDEWYEEHPTAQINGKGYEIGEEVDREQVDKENLIGREKGEEQVTGRWNAKVEVLKLTEDSNVKYEAEGKGFFPYDKPNQQEIRDTTGKMDKGTTGQTKLGDITA